MWKINISTGSSVKIKLRELTGENSVKGTERNVSLRITGGEDKKVKGVPLETGGTVFQFIIGNVELFTDLMNISGTDYSFSSWVNRPATYSIHFERKILHTGLITQSYFLLLIVNDVSFPISETNSYH